MVNFAASFDGTLNKQQRQAFAGNLEWHNRFYYEYELQSARKELVFCRMYIPEMNEKQKLIR